MPLQGLEDIKFLKTIHAIRIFSEEDIYKMFSNKNKEECSERFNRLLKDSEYIMPEASGKHPDRYTLTEKAVADVKSYSFKRRKDILILFTVLIILLASILTTLVQLGVIAPR